MPLTRIKQTAIGDDGVTTQKLDDTTGGFTLPGTQFVKIPVGTTAQRPGTAAGGQLRFNTTIGVLEQYNTNTNAWAAIDSPPIVTTVVVAGGATATDPAGGETITVNGSNFQTGVTVTVGGTAASSVTLVSQSQVTFTAPAKTAGDYDIVIANTNGLTATVTSGLSYNGTPAFTTAAGSLGSFESGIPIPTVTIVAAEPDGGTVARSVTTGALPAGLSLASNGQITGTPTAVSSSTTSTFTVTATDDESQTNTRQFSIVALRPVNAYNIPYSVEFNGTNEYLQKVGWPTSSDTSKTTFSAWVKKTNISNEGVQGIIFGTATAANSFNRIGITINNEFEVRARNSSGVDTLEFTSQKALEDTNAWYHLFVSVDFSQSGTNKVVYYINGRQYTDWDSSVLAHTANGWHHYNWFSGSNATMRIGRHNTNSSNTAYSGFQLAELQMIDGQIKQYTDFGEFYNGVWVPKDYTGTYGNCGFHLNFADTSDTGKDVSGNGNHFTSHNIASNNHLLDSPTNSFPHFDNHPSETSRTSIVGTQRQWKVNDTTTKYINIPLPTSGKWYWEWKVNGDNWGQYVQNTTTNRGAVGSNTHTLYAFYSSASGNTPNSTEVSNTFSGASDGDIMANRWDGDTGTMEIYQNNSKVAEYNAFTIGGPYYIGYDRRTSSSTGQIHSVNFGQDPSFNGNESTPGTQADANGFGLFKYAVPSGHLSLCSRNLNDTLPVVNDVRPEDFFENHLYSGNGATNSQTIGFRPDFVWIKRRDGNNNHRLYDSLNYAGPHTPGAAGGKYLLGNGNGSLATATTNNLTSFDANGFTVHGTGQDTNANTEPFIAWCWKAGGEPTATNSAGAGNAPTSNSVMIDGVSSTAALAGTNPAKKISANTKSGFSIVKYTGTQSDATVAHGLTKKPVIIFIKMLTGTNHWTVFHEDVVTRNNDELRLNDTGVYLSNTNSGHRWNIATMSNTVIGIQGAGSYSGLTNTSGEDYVAYCWHDVEGYSSMGTYVGNNNGGNGAYVNCGFKPAFVMVKSFTVGTSGYDWVVFDNNRIGTSQTTDTNQIGWNPINSSLKWNTNDPENSTHSVEFYSTGFKHHSSAAGTNSSQRYIYMAFAENPQKYARGR